MLFEDLVINVAKVYLDVRKKVEGVAVRVGRGGMIVGRGKEPVGSQLFFAGVDAKAAKANLLKDFGNFGRGYGFTEANISEGLDFFTKL